MLIKDWKEFLIPYEQAVEELKVKFKSIRKQFRSKNEYSPIEFVTGRVKEVSSILEKSKKLDIPLNRIYDEMEDIAGIRIMCQFVEDIYKVVQIIHQRNGKDLNIIYEKDYVKNKKESGYRSYHIIIKYPVQTAEGEKEILAEIQIRTLGMNFWATIEHSLNYKYKQSIPENIKERLKKAGELAFLLDQEMSQIKEEIVEAQTLFEIKSNIISDILDNIITLYSLGRISDSTEIQNKFNELLEHGNISELSALLEESNNKISKYRLEMLQLNE
ncbi:GTP pyrophosphokinase [Fervidicella metallireducens AeB]|uniref:GTP pyrophosphokinase n=1 Tax=Fervidicella metallireducens AeB TaxID=1403537 RepID=A0A017RUQ6_9CLOT|nr:GTP pyrophosphokinase family protein [Fervidicella metallireducens]EYE88144.1 GTP pyrophosphokinase [Fervidicella metallireducens AeB]